MICDDVVYLDGAAGVRTPMSEVPPSKCRFF